MPWAVEKTDQCPDSKPWGVIREGGEVEGCHETEEMANRQRDALYAQEGKAPMKHMEMEAKAVATEKGEFTAIAAAYTVDRVGDRIIPGAFEATIARWQASGKQIPLHWNHEGSPESIIGTVDPGSVKETDQGLLIAGRLDLENSDVAKEAWRAMKSESMGLSFGYMATDQEEAEDGINDLKAIDLFEFSIAPGPANFDTRVLDMKSVPKTDKPPEAEVEDVSDEGDKPSRKASDPEADEYELERLRAFL